MYTRSHTVTCFETQNIRKVPNLYRSPDDTARCTEHQGHGGGRSAPGRRHNRSLATRPDCPAGHTDDALESGGTVRPPAQRRTDNTYMGKVYLWERA
jgi:hypothetical protein